MDLTGKKIRVIREIKNISQHYVAQKLGISQAAYSNIENGKTEINESKLHLIASILEVPIDTIKKFDENNILHSNTYEINREGELLESAKVKQIHFFYKNLLAEKESYIEFLENELKEKSATSN